MQPSARPPTLASMIPSVYLPTSVYEVGNGAVAPIVAIVALQLGATPVSAALLVALLGVGQLVGNLPSAALAAWLGDRRAMVVAGTVAAAAMAGAFLAPSVALFALCLFVLGMCNATFYLARQAHVTEIVPTGLRARAMSTLGGVHRIGLFVGPFVGAAVISVSSVHAAFLVGVVAAATSAVLLLVVPDLPAHPSAAPTATDAPRSPGGLLGVVRTHRRLYGTLGVAVLAVGATRAARQTVLPLWAVAIGLDPATTSLVYGVAGALDVALFYPAGQVMDRLGRLAVAVPSMATLGVALLVLPLTGELVGFTVVAAVMSVGNGIGSGIIMTLGADVAPPGDRLRFLSVWRLMSDSGNALGPTVVSAGAALVGLSVGIAVVGGVGLLAAAGLARWVPRYSPFATRAMVRAQR